MLSPHWRDAEDLVKLTKTRLEPGLPLSRSTPQLNSVMATQTELNAKESEVLKEKVHHLKMKRENLQKKLEEKLHALREVCLAEADIIGVLPPEFPVIPGQPIPHVKRRIGTEFTLSSKILERDASKANDAIDRLELEIEIQREILTATRKLADDKTLSKHVRKRHGADYFKLSEKLKSLEEILNIYRKERGITRSAYSKTTDDVEFSSKKKEDISRNSEPNYSTLPNLRRRRPTTPQPQSHNRDYYSNNMLSSAQMSDSVLPSVDSSSISSTSSSMISVNQNRLNPQTSPMSYRSDSSAVISLGYQQPSLGGYSQHPMSSSATFQRRKGSSVSPSTVESSDLTSSCSSSRSSLQLNVASDSTVHTGLYQGQQQQQQLAEPHVLIHQDSGLDSTDYSSYLRNTQKAYYAPNGKFSYGSLDRKKAIKKQLPSPDTTAALPVELAELRPSKFGSKRESAVDSQDSPFQFEEDSVYSDKLQSYYVPYKQRNPHEMWPHNGPSLGKLKELSSGSLGVVFGLSPTEELRSITEHNSVIPDKRRHRRLPEQHDASFHSGSFQFQQIRNPDINCRRVSEVSEMHDYSEALRSMQQKHLELNRVKTTPSSLSVNGYEPVVQTRKSKPASGQSLRTQARKLQSRQDSSDNSNEDAVDALFNHNNRQSQLNAYDYSRRSSSVSASDLLPNRKQLSDFTKGNASSSQSSLSSMSVKPSATRPLRFVKVITDDAGMKRNSSGQHGRVLSSSSTTTSSTLTPNSFEIDACSTLV